MPSGKNDCGFFDLLVNIVNFHALLAASMTNILLVVTDVHDTASELDILHVVVAVLWLYFHK